MKLNSESMSFMNGKKFSNGFIYKIGCQNIIYERNAFLKEIAKGKIVVHFGCCDHDSLIHNKIDRNNYLHKLLQDVSRKIVGVDINEKAINTMRSYGFENIYLLSDVPKIKYDVLILSDVIEHVSDVHAFLQNLHQYDFQKIVVTSPNAYRLYNRLQCRGEVVNTDHKYWFSPFTLAKVLINAGFQVERMEFTDTPSKRNFVRNMVLKKFPILQDGLLAVAKKAETTI